jgi:hypothetical protein
MQALGQRRQVDRVAGAQAEFAGRAGGDPLEAAPVMRDREQPHVRKAKECPSREEGLLYVTGLGHRTGG